VKPISIRGKPAAGGKLPILCAPLVGATREALLAEAATALQAKPDIVEWRVDFFRDIGDAKAVVDAGKALRGALPGMPILFTCRSAAEGGNPVALGENALVALYGEVCAAGCIDLADYEMNKPEHDVQAVREAARRHGIGLVLSYHNFRETPAAAALAEKFRRAQDLGGDVAKVAVMPKTREDVMALLSSTLRASQTLELPLISMSMGPLGAISRIVGFAFGSALSFGVAAGASAPGQMPIAELRNAIEIARKAMNG
jgi:3-dehydroquinate dehydratase-1